MERHLNHLALLMMSVLAVSCDKEPPSKNFEPFYKLTVNGRDKAVGACGTSDYVAQYLKDTAVFVGFGCGGRRAGFYLKGRIADGTYYLSNSNQAWYHEEPARYSTDSLHQGTLTLQTGYYQEIGGSIPYIKGEISFDAVDRNNGKVIKVSRGKFLLRKYQF